MNMFDEPSAEVTMRPVCECGHIFEELWYNVFDKGFRPYFCPNCKRHITTLSYVDIIRCRADSYGDICICG